MTIYYGLLDMQLGGFKGGYAGENLVNLVKDGAERVVYLSQGDTEPISTGTDPLEVLKMSGYEIRKVSRKEYEKIAKSELTFLTEIVKGVTEGNTFDWERAYIEGNK